MKNKTMKPSALPAVFFTGLLLFAATGAARAADLIPTNAGFEQGSLSPGWAAAAGATASKIAASSDWASEGAYSCKFDDPTSAFSGRGIESSSLLPLPSPDDYAFSLSADFYVYNPATSIGDIADTSMQLYIKWYDSNGTELTGKESGFVSGFSAEAYNQTYTKSMSLIAAPANAAYAKITIACKESVNNDFGVYVDNVQFASGAMPSYLQSIGLDTFDPNSSQRLKVFFPLSTPAGKPSTCRIVFNLSATPTTEQKVNLLIYDVKGRLVRTIVKGDQLEAKHYDYVWDGKDDIQQYLPCGMYIISVELADQDTGGVVKEQTVVAIGRKL